MNKTAYILIAALFIACSKDDSSSTPNLMGQMSISAQVNGEVEQVSSTRATSESYTIDSELVPLEDDLDLTLYILSGDERTLYMAYESLEVYNNDGELPYLPYGQYRALVTNGKDSSEEGAESAFFADSVEFTLIDSNVVSKSLDVKLANSIVQLKVTDSFNNYFAGGATLSLSTADGAELEVEFPLEEDAEEAILFVKAGAEISLEGEAIKQDTGTGAVTTTTFTKCAIGMAEAGVMNTYTIDTASAGGAEVTFTINDTIVTTSSTSIDVNTGGSTVIE